MPRVLGHLWMLPLSLLGAFVALVGGVKFAGARGGALIFMAKQGGLVDWVFSSTGTAGAGGLYGAFIFVKSTEDRLIRHELRHMAQAMVFGVFQPILYALHSAWLLAKGRNAYWDNAFEVDARRAEVSA